MGTHPIFESDFDCLTVGSERMPSLIEVAKKNPFNKPVVADGMVEFGSNEYYAKCAVGGAISCGLTHTMIVPLDLVKCRMQVDKVKYPSLGTGFKVTIYQYVVPKPREECTKSEQLTVTFAAGYIAGVFCAIVSHPADSVVSVLNKNPESTAGQVLKDLGPKGVWKGLVARIIMIGTLTALQWFIYDGVKVALTPPRPPPPAMPESLRKKLAAQ